MSVTDWKFPATAANVDRDSKTAWINPDYAKADDANAADWYLKNESGDWLRLTNFGFSSSDIPVGATINGFEFIISRRTWGPSAQSSDLYLFLINSGGQVSSNLASAMVWYHNGSTFREDSYGGAFDLCGWSGANQSDIVSSSFGFDFAVAAQESNCYVNYFKIRVYYTEGGGSPTYATQGLFTFHG